MADDADISFEREELARQSSLVTSKKPEGPHPTGRCLWCDEIVGDGVRWCTGEHRDLWEAEQLRFGRR